MRVTPAIQQGFRNAPFMAHLGVELVDLGSGWCESRLVLLEWHVQQTGVAHAGVVAALADHTAGAAASTDLPAGQRALVAKLNATTAVVTAKPAGTPAAG